MTSILKIKSPVPSDIEIAQSVIPLHISLIAEALGLEAGEIDLYGAHKAKVSGGYLYTYPSMLRLELHDYLAVAEHISMTYGDQADAWGCS